MWPTRRLDHRLVQLEGLSQSGQTYSFTVPDLGPTGTRDLRDPDEDWDEDIL